jgi:cytoskeletal protein RodZ
MNPADEMAAKIEPTKRQPAGAVAGSDDTLRWLRAHLEDLVRTNNQRKPVEDLHGSDDKLNEQFKDFRGASLQPKPVEDLDNLIPRVSRLDDEISDRVRARESRTKRRSSRGFARFLVAICIGVAGTLAWQSYGQAAKQMLAAKAPELGWSPETKQMIANWVEQLGWTKPPADAEKTAVHPSVPEAQTVPAAVAPQAPATPPIDPGQVHQIAVDLTALRQTVEQIAAGQDQMARKVDRLQAADQEILVKIPESPPPPPPIATAPAVAGQPAPGGSAPSQNTQNTALRASCGPDVQRLCRGISWENGGVIKCLNSHRKELSPTCDTHFNEMPVHPAAQKDAPKATSPNPVTPPPSRAPTPPPHP